MSSGCCKCGGEGNRGAMNTIILGASLGVSFLLLIIAAAVYHDYLPFLNIAFVVLVPIAVIIGDVLGPSSLSSYTETSIAWANFGTCSFGTIVISMFGLPLVLLHTGAVGSAGFGLWIASTVVTSVAAVWYWFARRAKDY